MNSPRPGFAVSSGTANQGARTPAGTPLLDGFLKIEMQTQAGSWQDVTIEILNQGIGGRQLLAPAWGCAEVSPDAIIRIQRLTKDGSNNRQVIAWAKSGLLLGLGADIKGRVIERPDKSFSVYAYASLSCGATRMEEEKVVEIACQES